jgi:hypothetical protein
MKIPWKDSRCLNESIIESTPNYLALCFSMELTPLLQNINYLRKHILQTRVQNWIHWKRGETCFYRAGNFANSHIFAISEIVRLCACHYQCLLVPDFTEWMSKSWPNTYAISAHYANSVILLFFIFR